jgi:hypothetical protein
MIQIFYVWSWRGSSWRRDCWHQADPVGYPSEAKALARVEELLGYHRRRTGKEMYPPPIVWQEAPRWKPRCKEKKHHFTAQELNGHTYRREAVPEEVRR